jgi:hypothetical protein
MGPDRRTDPSVTARPRTRFAYQHGRRRTTSNCSPPASTEQEPQGSACGGFGGGRVEVTLAGKDDYSAIGDAGGGPPKEVLGVELIGASTQHEGWRLNSVEVGFGIERVPGLDRDQHVGWIFGRHTRPDEPAQCTGGEPKAVGPPTRADDRRSWSGGPARPTPAVRAVTPDMRLRPAPDAVPAADGRLPAAALPNLQLTCRAASLAGQYRSRLLGRSRRQYQPGWTWAPSRPCGSPGRR